MPTENHVRETVARCLSTMTRYHGGQRTPHSTLLMIAEVQAHAAWVTEMGLGPGEVVERVLRPVEAELTARYGCELGSRLNADFLKAFENYGTFDVLIGGRVTRPPASAHPVGPTTGSCATANPARAATGTPGLIIRTGHRA
jgi:hypothetical protein